MSEGSVFDSMRLGMRSEEEVAIGALFPTKDKFKMLQMITEQPPRAIIPWSVLGTFRRKYKSEVLKMFQEEYSLNKVAQERKGRMELGEVVVSGKRAKHEED